MPEQPEESPRRRRGESRRSARRRRRDDEGLVTGIGAEVGLTFLVNRLFSGIGAFFKAFFS